MKLSLIVSLFAFALAATLLAGCASTVAGEPQAVAPEPESTTLVPSITHAMLMTGTMPAGHEGHLMTPGTVMTGTVPAGHEGHLMTPGTVMTGTMPVTQSDALTQMMHDMQGLNDQMDHAHGMMMAGAMMTSTMPITHTMAGMGEMVHGEAASIEIMGHMMIMMGQMMQTMGQMHVMMAGGSDNMDHSGMMGGSGGMMGGSGNMDHSGMMGGSGNMDHSGMMGGSGGMMGGSGGMMGGSGSAMCMDGDGCTMMNSQPVSNTTPITGTLPAASSGSATSPTTSAGRQYPERVAEAGAVTVAVTPVNLDDPLASSLDFQVALNTHTVNLTDDLAAMAALRVGGREVAASSWQASAAGGHHVSGVLSFPALDSTGKPTLDEANTVTLIIRNLAGAPLRTFTWFLNPR